MALPGNPKQFARDVVDGFLVFGVATCRQLEPAELGTLSRLLEQLAREIRAEAIPLEQVVALQRRNLRLGRATSALLLIRSHAKRRRIAL